MWTSSTPWAYIGPNLWIILSLILVPLTRAGDGTNSFTIKGNNCGTYITFDTRTMDIHWRGAALEDDCSLYIALNMQSTYTSNSSLCVRAEVWDVADEYFTLTIESGLGYAKRKFGANEMKENVTYCAKTYDSLILRFFTYFKSRSHVQLKIIQTSYSADEHHNHTEPLPTAVYRLLGGIGAVIMVGLLASVILKRKRRGRQGYFGRGGLVISRAGETDETMVALYQPAVQNNPCTVTSTNNCNSVTNGYTGPAAVQSFPGYAPSQLTKPPEYSENPDNQNSFLQYPDSAPPRYEDVAGETSENANS
ncbi:uncharacterized protein LOC117330411 [Pecten maximus]|uniref:uncharacterized protein LOC117330411 n=1 Tax=Pecten maximus TaxID=6579 RepID=UPI001458D458|nr:uncharacterized protein LOC117330411 [Pecten maximus]